MNALDATIASRHEAVASAATASRSALIPRAVRRRGPRSLTRRHALAQVQRRRRAPSRVHLGSSAARSSLVRRGEVREAPGGAIAVRHRAAARDGLADEEHAARRLVVAAPPPRRPRWSCDSRRSRRRRRPPSAPRRAPARELVRALRRPRRRRRRRRLHDGRFPAATRTSMEARWSMPTVRGGDGPSGALARDARESAENEGSGRAGVLESSVAATRAAHVRRRARRPGRARRSGFEQGIRDASAAARFADALHDAPTSAASLRAWPRRRARDHVRAVAHRCRRATWTVLRRPPRARVLHGPAVDVGHPRPRRPASRSTATPPRRFEADSPSPRKATRDVAARQPPVGSVRGRRTTARAPPNVRAPPSPPPPRRGAADAITEPTRASPASLDIPRKSGRLVARRSRAGDRAARSRSSGASRADGVRSLPSSRDCRAATRPKRTRACARRARRWPSKIASAAAAEPTPPPRSGIRSTAAERACGSERAARRQRGAAARARRSNRRAPSSSAHRSNSPASRTPPMARRPLLRSRRPARRWSVAPPRRMARAAAACSTRRPRVVAVERDASALSKSSAPSDERRPRLATAASPGFGRHGAADDGQDMLSRIAATALPPRRVAGAAPPGARDDRRRADDDQRGAVREAPSRRRRTCGRAFAPRGAEHVRQATAPRRDG